MKSRIEFMLFIFIQTYISEDMIHVFRRRNHLQVYGYIHSLTTGGVRPLVTISPLLRAEAMAVQMLYKEEYEHKFS